MQPRLVFQDGLVQYWKDLHRKIPRKYKRSNKTDQITTDIIIIRSFRKRGNEEKAHSQKDKCNIFFESGLRDVDPHLNSRTFFDSLAIIALATMAEQLGGFSAPAVSAFGGMREHSFPKVFFLFFPFTVF